MMLKVDVPQIAQEPSMQDSALSRLDKETAFLGLIERNQKRAFWMALDILGSESEAEDLSQEAFIRAYERWDDFRGESSIDTWFCRILINLCLSHQRRRGIWFRIQNWLQKQADQEPLVGQSFELTSNPEQLSGDRDTADAIRAGLLLLSERQRAAFVLRYLHDFSIQEIAEATQSAPGTVKSHLFRALKTMRESLAFLQPGDGDPNEKSV